MESIAKLIKSTLHFISMVQDVCDQKRMLIEQKYLQEYNAFLTEWNKAQKTAEKYSPKKEVNAKCAKTDKIFNDASAAELLEELALADSLLEKARSIRNKNKIFSKPDTMFMNGQPSNVEECSNLHKPNFVQNKVTFSKHAIQSAKQNKAFLTHSRSATLSMNYGNSDVPRSKSENFFSDSKHNELLPANTQIQKGSLVKKCIIAHAKKHINTTESSVSVVTKKELSSYKTFHADQSHVKEKEKQLCGNENLCSDLTQHATSHFSQPTKRTFINLLKSKLNTKSFLHLSRNEIWYPFMSSKNKDLLLTGTECSTVSSLNKASDLLHRIQEIMLWIDLFYLIGKGILPNLIFSNGKDLNGMRMHSYIMSIFHETFQRIPLLDPNR